MGKDPEFFTPVASINRQFDLVLRGADPEAQIETEVLDDGKLSVTMVYPLDDNEIAEDGRVYLKDKFIWDKNEKSLLYFRRSCEANGALPERWATILQGYQEELEKAQLKQFNDPDVQKFGAQILPTRLRSLNPPIKEVLRNYQDFLLPAVKTLREIWHGATLKMADPSANYQVLKDGDEIKIIFSFPFDNDSDPSNRRFFMNDQFIVSAKDRSLKAYSRTWSLDPKMSEAARAEFGQDPDWLNSQTKADPAVAKELMEDLLPLILSSDATPLPPGLVSSPEGEMPVALKRAMRKEGLPEDFHSPWEKKLKTKRRIDQATQAATQQGLELMYTAASEQLARRIEQRKAWLASGESVSSADQSRLESIFRKAVEANHGQMQKSPWKALEGINLTADEAKLRGVLLEDPLMQKINAAAQDPDEEIRGLQLLQVARENLLNEEGFAASAKQWASVLQQIPSVKTEAHRLLNLMDGNATFGENFEALLPVVAKEITRPSSLVTMGVAGLSGSFLGLQGMRALGRYGWAGRLGAGLTSVVGESLAFTTVHDGIEAFYTDPDRAFGNWSSEMLSGLMLFGAMRATHFGNEGLWKVFGVEGKSRFGKYYSILTEHLGGIAAIRFSNALSEGFHLIQETPMQANNPWLSATITHFQARAGFQLASNLSHGALERQIRQYKIYQDHLAQNPKTMGSPNFSTTTIVDDTSTQFGREPLKFFHESLPDIVLQQHVSGDGYHELKFDSSGALPLDHYFFQSPGNRLRMQVNERGETFLFDSRSLRTLGLTKFMRHAVGMPFVDFLPMKLNGVNIPTQQWVPVVQGDRLEFLGMDFGIRRMNVPFIHELAKMTLEQQHEFAEIVAHSKSHDVLIDNLQAQFPSESSGLNHAILGVMNGRIPLHSLPVEMGIQARIRRYMEKALESSQERGFQPFDFELKKENIDRRLGKTELEYQMALSWDGLTREVAATKDLSDLRALFAGSHWERIENWSTPEIARKIAAIEHHNGNGIQDLPYSAGIRQRVRDLLEQEWFRKNHQKTSMDTAQSVKDLSLMRNLVEIEKWKQEVYSGLPASLPQIRIDKGDIQEAIYQVIERGKPLALVTESYGLREKVKVHQARVVSVAQKLFKKEMETKVDPFSGETIYSNNPEGQYRLALHLLNSRGGRPIRGLPSPKEIGEVISLVRRSINKKVSDDFIMAQSDLRHHLDHGTPSARALLGLASPAEKVLILDTYFGNYRRRDMPERLAFQTSLLMGQAGMYREVGVTYQIRGDQMRSILSLGDLSFVSAPDGGDFFLMHSHPEEYLTPDGRIMGAGGRGGVGQEASGRTIAFGIGEQISPDTRNILPSEQDIKVFLEAAHSYWRLGYPQKFGKTPLYEPEQRVFKNFIFNSYGSSELRYQLSASGRVEKIVVRYTFRDQGLFKDMGYMESMSKLKFLAAQLSIPMEFQKVKPSEFSQAYPFPVQGFF